MSITEKLFNRLEEKEDRMIENAYINHHPKFDINEKSLLISAKVLGEVVFSRLENE